MTFGLQDPFQVGLGLGSGLFALKHRWGGHRGPRKPETQEPLEEDPPPAAAEPEEKKDKVVLRNPKWEVEEVGFNEETEVSVEAELPAAQAHRTKVLFELYAKTPAGPERISQAEGTIDAGKARAHIPVYMPQYQDDGGEYLAEVEYWFTAKHSLSDLLEDDTVVKLVKGMANLLIESCILPDVTFAIGSSRVRPGQAPALKALGDKVKAWKEKHADGRLAVFGHADAVGKEEPNQALSARRARAIHAFLMKDPAEWEKLFGEEKWGLKSTQELLKHLGHDPGPINGHEGKKTKEAVKTFEASQGLPETGDTGAKTRAALYKAFMEANNPAVLKEKDFDAIDGKPHAGCSEFNRAEDKEGESEPNRRVSVFLLKSNKNFPIQYPCKHGDLGPCRKQIERKGERRTPGFGCLFYDKLVTEEVAGAAGKNGKVKLVGAAGATLKQYVNMEPEEGKPEYGMDRLLEVEVEGLVDGDEVYWVVKPGPKNSARTEPRTGPKLSPEEEPAEYQDGVAAVISTVSDGKSSIWLRCGVCGGDEFIVEAGGARDRVDCTVKVVTWRKLEYEVILPKPVGGDRATDWTVFTPDKKPGLPAKSKAYLEKTLGQGFVEFEQVHADCYDGGDMHDEGKHNILDASHVGKARGTKFVAADTNHLRDVMLFRAKHAANKRAVSIIWTDYLVQPAPWRENFGPFQKERSAPTSVGVFERAVATGAGKNLGAYAITSLSWAVSHWFDDRAGHWKPVDSPDDPGYAFRAGGTFTDEADIKAHVRFDRLRQITFLYPDSKAAYPGKKVRRDDDWNFVDKGKVLGLTMKIVGVGATTRFNGMALEGKIWMTSWAGSVDPEGMAAVIAHELGHNMGQAYADKGADAWFGRPPEKQIPGVPFPKNVPEGDAYGGKGHQGTHCAKGVVDKGQDNYAAQGSTAFAEHTCVMFGATDIRASGQAGFCEDCLTYIRAEELSDIRKSWR